MFLLCVVDCLWRLRSFLRSKTENGVALSLFRLVGRYLVSSVLVPFRCLVTQCLIVKRSLSALFRGEDRRFRCSLQSVFMSRADSSLIALDCLLGSYNFLATSCSLWKLAM